MNVGPLSTAASIGLMLCHGQVLQGQVNTQSESDQVKGSEPLALGASPSPFIHALTKMPSLASFTAILPTLRAQHALTLSLASKLAAMHDELEEMKQVYAHLWRQRGSFSQLRDPFVEAGLTNSSTSYSSMTSSQLRSLTLQ